MSLANIFEWRSFPLYETVLVGTVSFSSASGII